MNETEYIRKRFGRPVVRQQDPLARLAELRRFMQSLGCVDRLREPVVPPRKVHGRARHAQ